MSLTEAKSCFDDGALDAAIEACQNVLRSKPVDQEARSFLAELLCFGGNLDRADKQLDVLSTQAPESAAGFAMLRQVLRAAQGRLDFFHEGRVPTVVVPPDDHVRSLLRAFVVMRDGDMAEASSILKEAEQVRQSASGSHAGSAVTDLRDADDRLAGVIEVLTTNGEYAWVPFSSIERLAPRAVRRALDLLWRPALLTVRHGPDGLVYLPCVYEPADDNPMHILGRETGWQELADGVFRGFGLKTVLVGDRDVSILEMGEISTDGNDGIDPEAAEK